MRTIKLVCCATVLFAASPLSAAHHPFANEFDRDAKVTLRGVVSRVEWIPPHVTVYVEVGRGAHAGSWAVELGSPADLTREGWEPTTVKSGSRITVEGWKARGESRRVNAHEVTFARGRRLSAASSFEAASSSLASARRDADPLGTSGAQELPRSASPQPLLGLGGLLALAIGAALRARRTRTL